MASAVLVQPLPTELASQLRPGHLLTGFQWLLTKGPASSGLLLITQLVQDYTGIAEIMSLNPVQP